MKQYTQRHHHDVRPKGDGSLGSSLHLNQKSVGEEDSTSLRITPLGGQSGIGEKNMIVVEYMDDALILDCGIDLGIDIPGVNYAIPRVDYLKAIRHKIRGYVISHGHLDHIGGLPHIWHDFPAPIVGSRFTIGMIDQLFQNRSEDRLVPIEKRIILDMDTHERIKLGSFEVELIRVTHSIPESSAICIESPVGRIIHTGDFRLDPEPLDKHPTDVDRLRELGDKGVMLLMSESTNTTKPGRTPTEQTLQQSFLDIMQTDSQRVIAAVFSSNMNRVQMIVDAAITSGRKVAFVGRSMQRTADLALSLGSLKIPAGGRTELRMHSTAPRERLVVICTGGQGEPGAALRRMADGSHRDIQLVPGDIVVISSTPIPGNEQRYQRIGDQLAALGVKQYRHQTHEIDGCGPLHVSGHGNRDEHADMIKLTRPQYLMPIYGGPLNRAYHRDIGRAAGLVDKRILLVGNGDVLRINGDAASIVATVPSGFQYVDPSGVIISAATVAERTRMVDYGMVSVSMIPTRSSTNWSVSVQVRSVGAPKGHEDVTMQRELQRRIDREFLEGWRSYSNADIAKKIEKMSSMYWYRRYRVVPVIAVHVHKPSSTPF